MAVMGGFLTSESTVLFVGNGKLELVIYVF